MVLSSYTAATVSDLIADINASNVAGGSNTIALVAGNSFSLTAVYYTADGPNGLPLIVANDNLTIIGNGDAITRSSAVGTLDFRLLDVASGGTLSLQNLTLEGGIAFGAGAAAEGGAVYNRGTLDLNEVTVQNNTAQGSVGLANAAGNSAAGGGVFSSGVLTLEGGTMVRINQVIGGNGGRGHAANRAVSAAGGGPGGDGDGGGLYVSGGTMFISSAIVSANIAQGGQGEVGPVGVAQVGGNGVGGGMYMAGGSATLTEITLSANAAQGGPGAQGAPGGSGSLGGNGGAGGDGSGGGLNLAGGTATLASSTLLSNSAQGGAGGLPGKKGTAAKFEIASGNGGAGGNGYGGGLHASAGTVTLTNDTVRGNAARGGAGAPGNPGFTGFPSGRPGLSGIGEGGGLYIGTLATVYLDAFTQTNVISNTASTSDPNIHGTWHGS